MKIKIAEIYVTQSTLDAITENWKQHNLANKTPDLLDEVAPFLVKLRVPFEAKNELAHMSIPSEVKIHKTKNKILLSLHCNILKPIIMFAIILLLGSILFFLPNQDVLSSVIIALIIASAYFLYFLTKIARTGNRFLSALKEQSV